MEKDNKRGHAAVIEALEKENGELRENLKYVCRHVDKYRKLVLQLRGRLAVAENMAEELQGKLEGKRILSFMEVYYETFRQILS